MKKNFVRRAGNFVIINDKLYLHTDNTQKEVVPDDNEILLNHLLSSLHLPDHTRMRAIYENYSLLYLGFKRNKIYRFLRFCLICRRHEPLPRVSSIIPIVADYPWHLVQMDCVDMCNYADVNDDYG